MRLRDKELSQGWGQIVTPFGLKQKVVCSGLIAPKTHKTLSDNRTAAKEGGVIAGDARKALEVKSGKPVVSAENYLPPVKKKLGKK